MPNEFVIRNGAQVSNILSVTGSTNISGSSDVLNALATAGGTAPVFNVFGTSGQLFTVTDGLEGSLFSVNTISGLPIIEAFSTGKINLGAYSSPALIITGSKVSKIDFFGSLQLTGSILGTNASFISLGTTSSLAKLNVAGTTNVVSLYGSTSEGVVFDVNGPSGQLFSVVDGLSGSLFSVNTISGLPLMEVFSDGLINIGSYANPPLRITGSQVIVTNNLTVTGSLTVSGSSTFTNIGPAVFSGSITQTASTASFGGLVGIGTTNPTYALEVSGSGGNQGVIRSRRLIAYGGTAGDPPIATTSTIAGLFEVDYAQLGFSSYAGEAGRIETNARLWNIGMTGGTAKMNIRGTGATSATTALRVENSSASSSMVVLDNGNVGIGTTTPAAKLDVNGTTYLRAVALDNIFGYTGNNIQFTNAGNTTFTGNVGIGTTAPTSTLDIQSTTTGSIRVSGSAGSQITLVRPTAGLFGYVRYITGEMEIGTNSGDGLNLNTLNTARLTIQTNGDVGIGTTAPSAKLQVKGSGTTSSTTALRVENSSGTARLTILDDGTSAFNTSHLYISSSGNVGIGTSTPPYKFTISEVIGDAGGNAPSGVYISLSRASSGVSPITTYFTDERYTLNGTNSFGNSLGKQLYADINSTGTNTQFRNIASRIHTNSAGAAYAIAHYITHAELNGTGTVSNWFGTVLGGIVSGFPAISAFQGTSTITNTYGLFLGSFTAGTQTNAPYAIYQAGTEKIYLQGNVGIGTTSPGHKLHVVGTAKIDGGLYLGGNADVIDPSSNSGFMTIGSNQPIRFTNASSTEFIRITTTGNVGIGTISPSSKLHVKGSGATSSTTTLTVQNSDATTLFEIKDNGDIYAQNSNNVTISSYSTTINGNNYVRINGTDFGTGYIYRGGTTSGFLTLANDGLVSTGITLYGSTHASLADSIRINQSGSTIVTVVSGSVGIGTSTPNSTLHVSGSTYLYKSGSTVLDIQGSQGQLFSVVDSLTGSLMSVNDVSGLPILEVFSDDRVVMGTYGNPAIIISGSVANVTGSLVTQGQTLDPALIWFMS